MRHTFTLRAEPSFHSETPWSLLCTSIFLYGHFVINYHHFWAINFSHLYQNFCADH